MNIYILEPDLPEGEDLDHYEQCTKVLGVFTEKPSGMDILPLIKEEYDQLVRDWEEAQEEGENEDFPIECSKVGAEVWHESDRCQSWTVNKYKVNANKD